MKWYLAKIVYQIICGDGRHTAQFDEQFRLIKAGDKKEAFEKATSIGKMEEEVFYNQKQQLVQWRFVNVSELYPFNEHMDGAELFSTIKEVDDAETYRMFVHEKAQLTYNSNQQSLSNVI